MGELEGSSSGLSSPSADVMKQMQENQAKYEADQKFQRDCQARLQALTLSVESLKSAGHPNPVDVMSRAEKFKAYILEGKIS